VIVAQALPVLAAAFFAATELGAPWQKLTAEGGFTLYADPSSIREEGGERLLQLRLIDDSPDPLSVSMTAAFACPARKARIASMAELIDGKRGKTIPTPKEKSVMRFEKPMTERLYQLVCHGKPLA